jgi:hypothetical protein
MSAGKVKASKVRTHRAPEGTTGLDGQHHVYVYDVFHRGFLPGRSFDSLERAAQFMRHEQERIYTEQEAEPELFDYPFLSEDPDLIARIERDAEYRDRLMRDLDSDARARARGR